MKLNRVLFNSVFLQILISVFYSHKSSQNSLTNSGQPKFLLDTLHTSPNTNDWSILDVDHEVYSIVLPNGQTITINVNWKAINNPSGFTIPLPFPEFKQYINETIENNWIISSYIDAKNATSLYIVVSCLSGSAFTVDCHSSFTLKYLESNVSININDTTTELFSSAIRHDLANITDKTFARFNITSAGFYLGINNNGVQTQINGIQVYFYECPVIHNALDHIPVSSAPDPIIEPKHVLIQCPTDSSNLLAITAECYANGSWAIPDSIACNCNAGYRVVSQSSAYSCEACPIDTYKQSIGNANCTVCPANSHTNGASGKTGCVCRDGFFRDLEESVVMSCGTSPSAPRNLTVERASSNSTELTLRWDEPSSLGGRDISLLVYEVSYCRTSAPTQLTRLNQTSNREFVFMIGFLTASTEYFLTVTSLNNLNAVSNVNNNNSITVLSSSPIVSSIMYSPQESLFYFAYRLDRAGDYIIQLTYSTLPNSSNMMLNVSFSSNCSCSTVDRCSCTLYNVSNLNSSLPISIQFFISSIFNVNIIPTNSTATPPFDISTTTASKSSKIQTIAQGSTLIVVAVIVPIIIIIIAIVAAVIIVAVIIALLFMLHSHRKGKVIEEPPVYYEITTNSEDPKYYYSPMESSTVRNIQIVLSNNDQKTPYYDDFAQPNYENLASTPFSSTNQMETAIDSSLPNTRAPSRSQNKMHYEEFISLYEQYMKSDELNYQLTFIEQFSELNSEAENILMTSHVAARPENVYKNPVATSLPYDSTRVELVAYNYEGTYINASYISSDYIVTMHPTSNTVADFVRLLYQTRPALCILLTTPAEKIEMLSDRSERKAYWPLGGEELMINYFSIKWDEKKRLPFGLKQELTITHMIDNKQITLTQLISEDWEETGKSTNLSRAVQLIDYIDSAQARDSCNNRSIIVHCTDAIGKSGVLLTVLLAIDEAKNSGTIDIFQAIKSLRSKRMNIVPTIEHFNSSYALMNDYCKNKCSGNLN